MLFSLLRFTIVHLWAKGAKNNEENGGELADFPAQMQCSEPEKLNDFSGRGNPR
jgi:hypothetical protein